MPTIPLPHFSIFLRCSKAAEGKDVKSRCGIFIFFKFLESSKGRNFPLWHGVPPKFKRWKIKINGVCWEERES